MDSYTTLLMSIITILVAVVGYFAKKTYDKTETIGSDVAEMKAKVDILWKDKLAPATSPRQLNERGAEILAESGIKNIIDEKTDYLTEIIKRRNVGTAYDAEMTIEEVVNELPELCPDVVEKLKEGAFRVGADLQAVLYVGSIYLRNKIFGELGFKIEDLDRT